MTVDLDGSRASDGAGSRPEQFAETGRRTQVAGAFGCRTSVAGKLVKPGGELRQGESERPSWSASRSQDLHLPINFSKA